MKALVITRLVLFASLVALGCQPTVSYAPAGSTKYDPTPAETEIAVLSESPTRSFETIGIVEVRAGKIDDAMPKLKHAARDAGGHAILDIQSNRVTIYLQVYKAAVIRYTEASP